MTADLWAIADRPAPPVIPGQLAVPNGPAIGSLCTGYGGLDMAVQQVLGGHLAWVADPDPGAAAILAHHHPQVPNLGDITVTDWATVPPVDVLCGGYPCQPFSVAGLRKGTADERHIWPYIATAIRVLRPRLCLFENVAGHVRLGLADVLADLAALGFDAEWTTVRASDVGGAHQRERLFLLAVPSDAQGVGRGEGRPEPARQQGRSHAVGGRRAAPDASSAGLAGRRADGAASDRRGDAADTGGRRLERLAERHRKPQSTEADHDHHQPDAHRRGVADADAPHDRRQRGGQHGDGGLDLRTAVALLPADTDGEPRQQRRQSAPGETSGGRPSAVDCGCDRAPWGRYAPAIHRWEQVTGTSAPSPVNDRGRLAPVFVEWLMGLPAGHVTAVPGLSRTRQLKALGNGVVPLQGATALRLLLDRTTV